MIGSMSSSTIYQPQPIWCACVPVRREFPLRAPSRLPVDRTSACRRAGPCRMSGPFPCCGPESLFVCRVRGASRAGGHLQRPRRKAFLRAPWLRRRGPRSTCCPGRRHHHQQRRFRPECFGSQHLGGELEIHDITAIVFHDMQSALRAGDRLGGGMDLIRSRAGEDGTRAGRVEHAFTNKSPVHRFMPAPPPEISATLSFARASARITKLGLYWTLIRSG